MRILDSKLSHQFINKLLEESQSVRIGLKGQYFLAHNIFKDFEAKIMHGSKDKPDIQLSDKEYLLNFLNKLEIKQSFKTHIEVKTFAWSYKSFSSVISSYKKRKQIENLFIGVSPITRNMTSDNVTLKNFNEVVLSVVVIILESVEKETSILWKEINERLQGQLEDGEVVSEIPLDQILPIMNYHNNKQISEKQKLMSEEQKLMSEEQKLMSEKQELIRKDITKLNETLEAILELLKEK